MRRSNIPPGTIFGRLTVVRFSHMDRQSIYECRCQCAATTYTAHHRLTSGNTKSCGCLRDEGNAGKHRMSKSAEYKVWQGMMKRCHGPNDSNREWYAARGIVVVDRWHKFVNFFADMGKRPTPQHTVERKDNNGPYSPDNCKWATRYEQVRNTRSNRFLELDGRKMIATDWAKESVVGLRTFWQRLYAGWDLREALTAPAKSIRHS